MEYRMEEKAEMVSPDDFYIAEQLTEWYHAHLSEDIVLGKEATCFEDIVIPSGTYVIFETEWCEYPTQKYVELCKRIVSEWLPSFGLYSGR